ncbi:MAG: hypothetical protein FWD31_05195, partial [Planctomycetaceae bacterium]|nr:hypothetical protein [Planctomycetaceae bacterium]
TLTDERNRISEKLGEYSEQRSIAKSPIRPPLCDAFGFVSPRRRREASQGSGRKRRQFADGRLQKKNCCRMPSALLPIPYSLKPLALYEKFAYTFCNRSRFIPLGKN